MGQNTNYRFLLLSDHGDLADEVAGELESAGFKPVEAAPGGDGPQLVRDESPDVVVIAMPVMHDNALALCRDIRGTSGVPIIVVSARCTEDACVDALEAGADDYIGKPVGPRELAARVASVIRRAGSEPYGPAAAHPRGGPESHGVIQVGTVRLELTTCRVTVDGVTRTLTPNEFRLMAIFLRAPGEVFTREDLRRRVWPDDQHSLHLVEVHIANLRAKIEVDPHHPAHIVTVRSRGYKFSAP
jgi:two-component system, OmpR family, response regulator ResD